MQVKEMKLGERVIKYYPISELRQEFQKNLKELNLNFNLEFDIRNEEHSFVKGTLTIFKENEETESIITVFLPIDEIYKEKSYTSISNEFAKLETRIEKRLYTIYLGLEDPEEYQGEEEHIKETAKKEQEKILPLTPAQKNAIENILKTSKKESILEFMVEFCGTDDILKLTKEQASKVISFANSISITK